MNFVARFFSLRRGGQALHAKAQASTDKRYSPMTFDNKTNSKNDSNLQLDAVRADSTLSGQVTALALSVKPRLVSSRLHDLPQSKELGIDPRYAAPYGFHRQALEACGHSCRVACYGCLVSQGTGKHMREPQDLHITGPRSARLRMAQKGYKTSSRSQPARGDMTLTAKLSRTAI